MTGLRSVAAVEEALADRTRAEASLSKVNKGGKGSFTYVPWNETAKILNDVFGVFGWETRRTGGVEDVEHGIYIYDGELTVKASVVHGEGTEDEYAYAVQKTITGRGVGIVQGQSMEGHDTAAKAARSDFLSVAAKALGDGLGLFLYDKGDPAHAASPDRNALPAARPMGQAKVTPITPATQIAAPTAKGAGRGPRPSAKQLSVLTNNGFSEAEVAGLDFEAWKAAVDAIFAAPKGQFNKAAYEMSLANGGVEELDEIPF